MEQCVAENTIVGASSASSVKSGVSLRDKLLRDSSDQLRITKQRALLNVRKAQLQAEEEILEAEEAHREREFEIISSTGSDKSVMERVSEWAAGSSQSSAAEVTQRQGLSQSGRNPRSKNTMERVSEWAAGSSEASAAEVMQRQGLSQSGRNPRLTVQQCNDERVVLPEEFLSQGTRGPQPREEWCHNQPTRLHKDRSWRPAPGPSTDDSGAADRIAESIGKALSLYSGKSRIPDLPTFSGDPTEWIAFKSIFCHTTDYLLLNNCDNLYRLQKSLKGAARESVAALLLSPENVQDIMTSLENVFGNTNHIIEKTIKGIKETRRLEENSGVNNLIQFACKIKNLVGMLRALNSIGHLHNPELLTIIISKLPGNWRTLWVTDSGRITSDDPAIVYFSNWIDRMVTRAKDSGIPFYDKNHKEEYSKRYKPGVNMTSQRASCFTTAHKNKICCFLCKKSNHVTSKCYRFRKLSLEQRWDAVKSLRLCFKCLGVGHSCTECDKSASPDQKYHTLLTDKVKRPTPDTTENDGNEIDQQLVTNTFSTNQVLLKIVPVTLYGPNGQIEIPALLDDGSSVTLLESDVANKLGLEGPLKPLSLNGVSKMGSSDLSSRMVSIKIKGKNEENVYNLNARTIQSLHIPEQTVLSNSYIDNHEHLKNAPRFNVSVKPRMLIGQNNWGLIISRGLSRGPSSHITLSRTLLGWVAMGHVPCANGSENEIAMHIRNDDPDIELHNLIKDSFKLDEAGITNPKVCNLDKRALAILNETTRQRGTDEWETGLIWKEDENYFPDSLDIAQKRLETLERKMDKNKEFSEAYCRKMNHYITNGYARQFSDAKTLSGDNRWYLPHFAVYNQNKPGKIRIVFDAAAKSKGISLNDKLLAGPDLYNSLLGIIFKFRQHKIAFTADIQEMFLRIKIAEKDVPYQLFLWRGSNRESPPMTYAMSSMIFGAKSSPSSAQFVKNKNAERYSEEYPEAVEAIRNNHYMDDYLDSVDSVANAQQLIKQVICIHKSGGFNMTSWASNSQEALKDIPVSQRSDNIVNFEKGESMIQRTLGLQWDPKSDMLFFDLSFKKIQDEIISGAKIPTKREMLKVIMSIFDPPGFLSPVTVRSKILMQNVWRSGIDWDEKLNNRNYNEWTAWLKCLNDVKNVRIPRFYENGCTQVENRQLHIFCDSSEKAICCVAYSRVKEVTGNIKVNFVASKTKVAPIRPISIPRLELQGALLGSRLAKTIIEQHSIKYTSTHLWTDSKTVMCWLQSDARNFKPFVSHRLGEIEELVGTECWRWLPSEVNVADEGTRDSSELDLSMNGRWFTGPEFLKKDSETWPRSKEDISEKVNEDHLELKPEKVYNITVQTEESLINLLRFSKYLRALRATAFFLKFINYCRRKEGHDKIAALSADDLMNAEYFLIKESQNRKFYKEIAILQKGGPLPKESKLTQLNAFLDNKQILRLQGRISASDNVRINTAFPIILDSKDRLAELIIMYFHQSSGHAGIEHVLNSTRLKYWIINGRQLVRKIIFSCQHCKNNKAKPKPPQMGSLPEYRLENYIRPFTNTGMDYFGPIKITIKRRNEKRYGVLFTCLSTRAVHIEIAENLTTDSTIMAIRRFISRRGYPKCICSDNGTNLRGAEVEMRESIASINQNKIGEEMSSRNINWRFIPPAAPHHGGAWESLIKSVKRALYAILREQAPRLEVLHTLLLEAENIVNSRPLTHVSLDSRDDESLTPNHFLLGYRYDNPLIGEFNKDDLCLRKQWRIAQLFADKFWKRWVAEYLPTLVKRAKWFENVSPAKVGDVVIVCDNTFPRNTWPRGIITNTYPGKDNQVRVVEVKTMTGVYRRPITKIAILDVV